MAPLPLPRAIVVVGSYRKGHSSSRDNSKKTRFLIPRSQTFQACLAAVLIMILILGDNMTSAIEVDARGQVVAPQSKTARGGLRAGAPVDSINNNNIDSSTFQSTSNPLVTDAQAAIASQATTNDKIPVDGDGELAVASNALLASDSNSKSSLKHLDIDLEDEDEPQAANEPQVTGLSELQSRLLPKPKPAKLLLQKSQLASEQLPLAYSNISYSNHSPRALTSLLRGHSAINISDSLQTEAMVGTSKKSIKTITLTTGMSAGLSSIARYLYSYRDRD